MGHLDVVAAESGKWEHPSLAADHTDSGPPWRSPRNQQTTGGVGLSYGGWVFESHLADESAAADRPWAGKSELQGLV